MGCVDQGPRYYADHKHRARLVFEQSEGYEVVIRAGVDTLQQPFRYRIRILELP